MRILVLLVLCAVPAIAVQRQPALVAADEGSRVRPIARVDAGWWSATCEVPPGARTRGGTPLRPVLVVSGDGAVEAIRYVPRGGTAWQQLEPVVRRIFLQQEKQEDVAAAVLAGSAISVDSIATSAEPATPPLYYFRASKRIPDPRGPVDLDADGEVDPRGDLRIDVLGWLRGTGDLATSIGTNTTLSWEQVDERRPDSGTRSSDLVPIGIVRAGDQRAWVMQGHAGSSTWYTVYNVATGGVRMLTKTDPGRC